MTTTATAAATTATPTFERAMNRAEVSPDQFKAMQRLMRNIWEIEGMNAEYIGRCIFPADVHGTYSDHFTGKLRNYCGETITAKEFVKWFGQLGAEWQNIVCQWLNARQF